MNPATDVWSNIMELIRPEMTTTTMKTWFDDVRAVNLEGDCLQLATPSIFKRDIIVSRYTPMIRKALHELFSADMEVKVMTLEEMQDSKPVSDFLPGTEEYTFDRFVVGNSNKFAQAASLAVANNPGNSYNPLFIYGDSGLGKTHLLYAIAHTVHEKHPSFRIVYIRGDAFTNELITAIREGRNAEFRKKYRECDMFLMDDVQFIAGRDSTQEEMFHTFNSLYEMKRQIIFSADRPPQEMLRLDDRLRTRFSSGLPAKIDPPDYETRVAIIKSKANHVGVTLPTNLLELIAENITTNVRQIEGTVNKILAYQDLMGVSISKETVLRAMKDMFKDRSDTAPTADIIIEEVCRFYNLEPDVLKGQGRGKVVSQCRQMAMYLTRRMTSLSLSEIGKEFGGRDHTTAMHSIERVEEMVKRDPEKSEILKDITANINARFD